MSHRHLMPLLLALIPTAVFSQSDVRLIPKVEVQKEAEAKDSKKQFINDRGALDLVGERVELSDGLYLLNRLKDFKAKKKSKMNEGLSNHVVQILKANPKYLLTHLGCEKQSSEGQPTEFECTLRFQMNGPKKDQTGEVLFHLQGEELKEAQVKDADLSLI